MVPHPETGIVRSAAFALHVVLRLGPLISITSKRSMDQETQWTPISSSVRRTSACMWPIRNTRRGLGGERVTTFEAASEARSLSPRLYRRLFVACQRDGPSQLSVCNVLEDPVQYKMEAVSHIRLGLDSHEFFVCKDVLAVQSPEFSRHPRRTAVRGRLGLRAKGGG